MACQRCRERKSKCIWIAAKSSCEACVKQHSRCVPHQSQQGKRTDQRLRFEANPKEADGSPPPQNNESPLINNAAMNKGKRPPRAKKSSDPQNAPQRKKQDRPICTHFSGCSNQVVNSGLCAKHGAKIKRCSVPHCSSYAQVGGVCTKHGAKKKIKLCSADGCKNQVRNGGVCRRHGARVSASARASSVTVSLAKKRERQEDDDEDGEMKKKIKSSSRKYRQCMSDGCTNQAYNGGVCRRHGAKVKLCAYDGCERQAKKGGVCFRHQSLMARHPVVGVQGDSPALLPPLDAPVVKNQISGCDDDDDAVVNASTKTKRQSLKKGRRNISTTSSI